MYKIDLHTHSIISPDGSITAEQYEKVLKHGVLDCVAITDHNTIEFAQTMHNKLGDTIIIGEEITTTDGEMIGLFLQKNIPQGLSARQTAEAIHAQQGLVCIPHPFEKMRKGIQKNVLEEIREKIDMIEVFNGRGRWRGKAQQAEAFMTTYHLLGVANSDAHGAPGLGTTYSIIPELPSASSLKQLLVHATLQKKYAPLWTFLYPAMNRLRSKQPTNERTN